MDNIIELLTSKEVIVVYIVIAVACLLCFIIYLVDRNQDKRKRKQNTKELNKLVEDVNEANEALNQMEAENTETTTVDGTSPVMVADGVDVVDEATTEIPLGPIREEQKTFMPEPSDLQAYNNFAEELEDDGPVRVDQPIVANTDVSHDAPMEDIPVPENVPLAPMEDNMVLDHMNQELDVEGAAPAVDVPEEDITISDGTTVPERERIEEIVYTNPEPTEEEATRELQKITEELEKAARGEAVVENPLESTIPEPPVEEVPVAEENVPGPEEFVPPVENITEEIPTEEPEPTEEVEEKNEVEKTVPEVDEIPVPDIPEPPVEEDKPTEEVVEPATEEEITVSEHSNNIDVAAYEN